jgi:hypothetical protein
LLRRLCLLQQLTGARRRLLRERRNSQQSHGKG